MKPILAVLCIIPSIAHAASLPQDFSDTQGVNGFYYESIGDSRSSNTMHPGSGVTLMDYRGEFSFGYPGDLPHPVPEPSTIVLCVVARTRRTTTLTSMMLPRLRGD